MSDSLKHFFGEKKSNLLSFIVGGDGAKSEMQYGNWSNTFSCQPEQYFKPKSIGDLKEILQRGRVNKKTIRCIGGGGSPSDLFCSDEYLVSTKHLNKIIDIDVDTNTLTVEAGASLAKINEALFEKGLALPVLPSVDFPTIGGVLGTGVHGSGTSKHILPDYVTSVELLIADGTVMHCSSEENADVFKSARVNLGVLGIITTITIKCVDAYKLKQTTYSLPFLKGLDMIQETIGNCSDHGKFYYYPNLDRIVVFDIRKTYEEINPPKPSLLWQLARYTGLLQLFFYIFLTLTKSLVPYCFKLLHYINFGTKTEFVEESFRVLHFDCLFSQHVSEWAIPIGRTCDFLREFRDGIMSKNLTVHGPVEIRFVKASDAYLSQTYGRDSTLFNVMMWRPFGREPIDKRPFWQLYEQLSLDYEGRPHWAKVHEMSAEFFTKTYPKFQEFLSVRERLDPNGSFVNDYIKRHLLQ